MFGITHNETIVAPPPDGVSALIFCVVDEKLKFHHHIRACRPAEMDEDIFATGFIIPEGSWTITVEGLFEM